MTDPDPYQLLTRREAAEHLRCTVQYISELTMTGKLYSVKVGKRVLIPRAAIVALIRGEKFGDDLDGAWPPTPSMLGVRTHVAVDGSIHDGPAHPCAPCDRMLGGDAA